MDIGQFDVKAEISEVLWDLLYNMGMNIHHPAPGGGVQPGVTPCQSQARMKGEGWRREEDLFVKNTLHQI